MKAAKRAQALGTEAGERKAVAPQRQVAFLSGMRMHSVQAALSGDYFEKYFNGAIRATGRGYLALTRQELCGFGMSLAEKLSVALAQGMLVSAKGAARSAKEKILNDQRLLNEWMEACQGNEHL